MMNTSPTVFTAVNPQPVRSAAMSSQIELRVKPVEGGGAQHHQDERHRAPLDRLGGQPGERGPQPECAVAVQRCHGRQLREQHAEPLGVAQPSPAEDGRARQHRHCVGGQADAQHPDLGVVVEGELEPDEAEYGGHCPPFVAGAPVGVGDRPAAEAGPQPGRAVGEGPERAHVPTRRRRPVPTPPGARPRRRCRSRPARCSPRGWCCPPARRRAARPERAARRLRPPATAPSRPVGTAWRAPARPPADLSFGVSQNTPSATNEAATANDAAQARCHAGTGRSRRPPTPCAAAGPAHAHIPVAARAPTAKARRRIRVLTA